MLQNTLLTGSCILVLVSSLTFKTPADLGMPVKFSSWKPGQFELIKKIQRAESEKRHEPKSVVGLCSPTGTGKTLTMLSVAVAAQDRTLMVTTDKGLQRQAFDDFGELGMVILEGKNNYPCPLEEDYTCAQGMLSKCPLAKTRDCSYTNAWIKANRAPYVITNYSNAISVNRYTKGIGKFDRIICDEGHQGPDHLSNAIKVELSYYDIGGIIQRQSPESSVDVLPWRVWAQEQLNYAHLLMDESSIKIERTPSRYDLKRHLQIQGLQRKLSMMARMNPADWIVRAGEHGYEFDAVNPARYARKFLFRNFTDIRHVVIGSGTLRPKSIEQYGFDADDFTFIDAPASFDPARFKIYLCPSMRINRDTRTAEDLGIWLMRMAQIIEPRQDRKGIIHCWSFDYQKIIRTYSKYKHLMMWNERGESVADAVRRFKQSKPGTIFVSPSVSMGYDFIGEYCEYQIIAKVPFDNYKDKLIAARTAIDGEYNFHTAIQRVEQMIGRGMRSRADSCENFLLDENFLWLIHNFPSLFSPFFWKYYVQTPRLPKPLPKLRAA